MRSGSSYSVLGEFAFCFLPFDVILFLGEVLLVISGSGTKQVYGCWFVIGVYDVVVCGVLFSFPPSQTSHHHAHIHINFADFFFTSFTLVATLRLIT